VTNYLLFSTPEMTAVWSPQSHVRRMLEFEAALARALARAGVIPPTAAEEIAAECLADWDEAVDILYTSAVGAGTLAIPLVEMLTERVKEPARGFVHWGATSQDTLDTALVLQIRDGIELLLQGLFAVAAELALLAGGHRRTLMPGRTLLQQALPITFGLKAARWLALVSRQLIRLGEVRSRSACVQLGGASGTLAALGMVGDTVTQYLAEDMGLAVPLLPWHTERDRIAEVAAALGVIAGAMGKIAGDVVLLAQTEVGEVVEDGDESGRGRSSALPQKRNPIDAVMASAASRLAIGAVPVLLGSMLQEHERAAGAWQAEWEALPDLFRFTMSAVEHVKSCLVGLRVEAARMRANLDASGGLLMAESLTIALAEHIGRHQAYVLVRRVTGEARASGRDLRSVARADTGVKAVLSEEALERALDPAAYLGSTDIYIDRALGEFSRLEPPRGEQHTPYGGQADGSRLE
jgi:3-carboxy-cis,cis-muconate cycloisomerase